MKKFLEVYDNFVKGAISGWDRIRFRGTLRWLSNTIGINTYLNTRSILLKDFGTWSESITREVRYACEQQSKLLDIPIQYLPSSSVDKEALARKIMEERKIETGPICMFSVVEPCIAPVLRRDKESKTLELEIVRRKCSWIYQYWNDEELGFGHTRLQTWVPLGVTVCINGRHRLERQLISEGIDYEKSGNCFTHISDLARAAELIDLQQQTQWSGLLNDLVLRNCPQINNIFGNDMFEYYWSVEESEWATDLMFNSHEDLDIFFPKLARHGLTTADSLAVMRFLGRTQKGRRPNEVRSDYRHRHEGVCVKHRVNNNSVKVYNKSGSVLRVETTINNTREFKVYRNPNDDATRPPSWQRMRKGVSDFHRRSEISQACNERYLDHLAAADVIDETLQELVSDSCKRTRRKGKPHRALNLWNDEDYNTLQFLARGENCINGFTNRQLRESLWKEPKNLDEQKKLSGRATRRIRLFRAHGLIRKVPNANRYHLTEKGRKITSAILAASNVNTQQLMELTA